MDDPRLNRRHFLIAGASAASIATVSMRSGKCNHRLEWVSPQSPTQLHRKHSVEEQRIVIVGVDRRSIEFVVVRVLEPTRTFAHGHRGALLLMNGM